MRCNQILTVACLLWALIVPVQGQESSQVSIELSRAKISTSLYVAELDLIRHMPTAVTYIVTAEQVTGDVPEVRDWWIPTGIRPEWTLEPEDFSGSAFDRGHLRALAFTRSEDFHLVNAMCVVAPQHYALNRGPWRSWESFCCELARQQGSIRIQINCEFGNGEQLPDADEPHEIPSGFDVRVQTADEILHWRFPNDATASGSHRRYQLAE